MDTSSPKDNKEKNDRFPLGCVVIIFLIAYAGARLFSDASDNEIHLFFTLIFVIVIWLLSTSKK